MSMSRVDYGLGSPGVTSSESLRLSSVSSADSGQGYSMPSPARVTVTTPTRVAPPPRAEQIVHYKRQKKETGDEVAIL